MQQIEIHACSIKDILDRTDLPEEYAAEIQAEGLPCPAPDRDLYAALESSGAYHCIGAYLDGRIVGFVGVVINTFPHYGRKGACTESFFVSKSYRHTRAGKLLLQAAEVLATDQGAMCLMVSSTSGSALERVMSRTAGYRHSNTVYMRVL
jgi:GNAT superfamily N-acetyltransferase